MNIEQMYEMQCKLDGRIIEEKGLRGRDLLPNTVLALQVELAELANEWRGFKHWSERQEPKHGYAADVDCDKCGGRGYWYSGGMEACDKCNGVGGFTNPLLAEYADCLHFFLSIARQKGWKDHLYISGDALEETQEQGLKGGIGGAFLEVNYWLMKMYMEKEQDERLEVKLRMTSEEFCFCNAWYVFIAIGLIGFGFTPEQIEEAYHEKNEVNHTRQQNGY